MQSQTPNGSQIAIILENSENSKENIILGIILANTGDGVPVGTYNAELANQEVLVSLWYDDGNGAYIIPDYDKTNQIILTSVEGTKIKGSYTFNVEGALGGAVSVTGSFDALGITSGQ